jgi:hypothetical protein
MRSPTRTWRLTRAAGVLLAVLVLLAILGLVLDGLASTLSWILFVLVVAFLVGPGLSPQTSTWGGPYRDRHLH